MQSVETLDGGWLIEHWSPRFLSYRAVNDLHRPCPSLESHIYRELADLPLTTPAPTLSASSSLCLSVPQRLRDAAAAWWPTAKARDEIAVISHDEVVGFAESGCIVAS